MTRARLVLATLWACASVVLLGTSASAGESPASWTCTTDALGVQTCNVTTWRADPEPSTTPAPTEVVVRNAPDAPVPVREVDPVTAPAPSGEPLPVEPACGSVELPCVVESGLDTMTAIGTLGLAGVLVGGVRIAQGLRR